MTIGKITSKYHEYLYILFRVLVGAMFLMHGLQKFGFLGGQAAAPFSLFWLAGVIEVLSGFAFITGFFTRLAAVIGAIEMLYAYATVHLPQGFDPLANRGEAALLYFAAFLVLMVYGAKKWSLEQVLLKKETF